MTTQTPSTEERLSRLEGAYEQVSERLGDLRSDMNERLNELARGQEALREEMNALRNEFARRQDNLRNTMLLLVGGAWATTVGGLIAILTQI